MLAAYHGHAPLVKLLMQHGADPNTLNDRGQSPLAGAVFKDEVEVIEVLLPYSTASNSLLTIAGVTRRRGRSREWYTLCHRSSYSFQARRAVESEV